MCITTGNKLFSRVHLNPAVKLRAGFSTSCYSVSPTCSTRTEPTLESSHPVPPLPITTLITTCIINTDHSSGVKTRYQHSRTNWTACSILAWPARQFFDFPPPPPTSGSSLINGQCNPATCSVLLLLLLLLSFFCLNRPLSSS